MPRLAPAVLAAALLCPVAAAQTWQFVGPTPPPNGQTSPTGSVAGAVQTILTDPNDIDRMFVGTVNGGVWRTLNGGTTWTPLTDSLGSLSIGGLAFDPADGGRNTLVAGFGRYNNSSYRDGGNRLGVTVSLDGGATWTNRPISTAATPDVNGVIARNLTADGGTIVASALVAGAADGISFTQTGIWRSTNGGGTWARVSGGTGTGLPGMSTYGVFDNPLDSNELFTVPYTTASGSYGVYRSTDTGATWTRLDTANTTLNTAITDAVNVRASFRGSTGYLGVIGSNGQLASLWRTTNSGSAWTQYGGALPQTNPGGQGTLHFNLLVNPDNASQVYLTGDATQTSPFNGRVFRVDFSTNTSTDLFVNGSNAPHADGRTLAVRADGRLLLGNDGGITSLTSPGGAFGTWTPLNGNLGNVEVHRMALDPVSGRAFGGTQDNGTMRQAGPGPSAPWSLEMGGDGGDVAVVARPGSPAQSLRYMSFQNLGGLVRGVYSDAGARVGGLDSVLMRVGGTSGPTLLSYENTNGNGVQFYGPIATNRADGNRFLVGTRRVYESTDQGNTSTVLRDFGSGVQVSVVKADGFLGAVARPEVLYVGTSGAASQVWHRPDTGGPLVRLTAYTFGGVTDLAVQATDWRSIVVSSSNNVYRSTDAGAAFATITGNLLTGNPGVGRVYSVETIRVGLLDVYFAGGRDGVYSTTGDALGVWASFGTALPDAVVTDIDYDPASDTLIVADLGRGIWSVPNVSTFFVPVPEPAGLLLVGAAGLAVRAYRRRRAAA